MTCTEAIVSRVNARHRVGHHVQIIAIGMAGQGRGGRLEVKVLRQHGSAEADSVHHAVHGFESLAFPSETAGPASKRALFEHELAPGVDGPIVAFTRPPEALGKFDETFVERQIVSDRIFPALVRTPKKREASLEELINFTQRQPFGRRALYRHDY